jgi:hypothetical protein
MGWLAERTDSQLSESSQIARQYKATDNGKHSNYKGKWVPKLIYMLLGYAKGKQFKAWLHQYNNIRKLWPVGRLK